MWLGQRCADEVRPDSFAIRRKLAAHLVQHLLRDVLGTRQGCEVQDHDIADICRLPVIREDAQQAHMVCLPRPLAFCQGSIPFLARERVQLVPERKAVFTSPRVAPCLASGVPFSLDAHGLQNDHSRAHQQVAEGPSHHRLPPFLMKIDVEGRTNVPESDADHWHA
eukprot:scaffold1199_cov265-Pinguiococcus_pyrenoidosus.AAC.3